MRASTRTLLAALAAVAVLLAGASGASAYSYSTDYGTVEVLEPNSAYIVGVDGASSNPDPADGYVGVNWNMQVCASADGGPDTNDDSMLDCRP